MKCIMLITNIISSLFRNFIIFLLSFYTFIKITNYKKVTIVDKTVILLMALLFSIIQYLLMAFLSFIFVLPALVFTGGMILAKIIRKDLNFVLPAIFLSTGIVFFTNVGVFIVSFFILELALKLAFNNFVMLSINLFVAFISIIMFFRIKRFREGFPFLQSKYIYEISMLLGVFVLTAYILAIPPAEVEVGTLFYIFIGIIAFIIVMFRWIRNKIESTYLEMAKIRRIAELEKDHEKLRLENKELSIENKNIQWDNVSSIHKINERLKALEEYAMESDVDLLDTTKIMKEEYNKGVSSRMVKNIALEVTGIASFDSLISFFYNETKKLRINFQFRIDSVNDMIDQFIPVEKLETLIGDLMRNAILAVGSGGEIFIEVGQLDDDCYGVRVSDLGAQFEISILLRLGLEPSTTRGDRGGTGVGFMTIFEVMRDFGASLNITENGLDSAFVKSVELLFDGKSEYIIKSYRADEISAMQADRRIIILNLID